MEEVHFLKATHYGVLNLGDVALRCSVLEDGKRVISRNAVFKAFGRTKRGRKKGEIRVSNLPQLPSFIDANNLAPYIKGDLLDNLISPVKYKVKNGRIIEGYDATIIPLICDVYLQARSDGSLAPQQQNLALKSELLVRSLSKVGIVALVDEATGYQDDRAENELQKLLTKYISKELLPWTKKFPDIYYEEIFRLRGWTYPPTISNQRPSVIGRYTNQFIYDQLPPGVKEELQRKNPIVKPGSRKWKHHQFLTVDIGNDHLEKQLIKVITLMQASENWESFTSAFNRVFNIEDQMTIHFE